MKLVIPKTNDGRTVRAVINNRICKGKEYSVVSPLEETFNAGKPEKPLSANAWVENPVIINITAEKDKILNNLNLKDKKIFTCNNDKWRQTICVASLCFSYW